MIDAMMDLYRHLQAKMVARWKRRVPFGDLVVDRWERATIYGFGEGTSVYDSCVCLGDVRVGNNCWIGPNTYLDGSGGLEIGDNVTVGVGSMIATHSSVYRDLSAGKEQLVHKSVKIEDFVFIGPGCFIEMGVTIGTQSVIEPHSVVKRSVPAGSIVMGNPGRIVGRVQQTASGRPQCLYDRRALQFSNKAAK